MYDSHFSKIMTKEEYYTENYASCLRLQMITSAPR